MRKPRILFGVAAMALTGGLCYLFLEKPMKNNTLKVAFPDVEPVSYYDPAKISYGTQYALLQNLYCSLIAYNENNQLVSSVAERFEWEGSNAYFRIREGLHTVDGHAITAKDVDVSFRRLFALGTNLHGDLKTALCGRKAIRTLSDRCPNIQVVDDNTIVFKFKSKNPFLFSMLTSADFSIIPQSAIDTKTLKIVDYRNTSGPYFVESEDGKGRIVLVANPSHYYYSKKMPEKLELIPSLKDNKSESMLLFESGRADIITTKESRQVPAIMQYHASHKDSNIFKTVPLNMTVLTFTPTGMKKFSKEERFDIAAVIRRIVLPDLLSKAGHEETVQIFPEFAYGRLEDWQLSKIRTELDKPRPQKFAKRISIWNLPKEMWEQIKNSMPKAELHHVMALPGHVDYAAQGLTEPDLFYYNCDSSVKEDISYFSYYLNSHFFYINGAKGKAWVNKYSNELDTERRLKMVNQLHYKTLLAGITFPLAFKPYVAIVRKPWTINYYKFDAGNRFWRVWKD